MIWIIIALGILILIFLIFRKTISYNESDNNIDNGNKLPPIDIDSVKKNITSISENETPIVKEQEETTLNKDENVHHKNEEIIWTAELIHIKSIMFLAPTQSKRTLRSKSNIQRQHCGKHESLTPIEQYELAVWFAELLKEADNLHKAKMFAEERKYCLNAIKWCAKEGLSVIYWQNRLNQINELLGIIPIQIADKSKAQKESNKKYLSASDKYELYKSITNPLEAEYQYHHSNKNIVEEQKVVQKAIKFAQENNLVYYEQKWVKRIINPPKEDKLSIEQRLKEKNRQRHTHDITPIKKKRRPRIPYIPKNIKEE